MIERPSSAAFSRLRELLSGSPCREAFQELIGLFGAWDEEETLHVGLDYAQEHLSGWDDSLRSMDLDEHWPDPSSGPPPPALDLARSWVVSLPNLGVEGARRIAESGLWRALRTIQVSGYENLVRHMNALSVLLELPAECGLCGLNMLNCFLGAGGLEVLVSTPPIARLTELDLTYNNMDVAAMEVLVNSPHLQGLKRLDLTNNLFGDDGVVLLAESGAFPALESLNVTNVFADSGGCDALIRAEWLSQLKELVLSGNEISLEGVEALAQAEHLSGLQTLALSIPARQALSLLADSPVLGELSSLELNGDSVEAGGLWSLVSSERLPKLSSLSLYGTHINPRLIDALANNPGLERITTLRLGGSKELEDSWAPLFQSPYAAGLQELRLSGHLLSDDDLGLLLSSASLSGLRRLSLQRVELEQLVGVIDQATHTGLESLSLGFGYMERALASGLSELQALAHSSLIASLRTVCFDNKAFYCRGSQPFTADSFLSAVGPMLLESTATAPQELRQLLASLMESGTAGDVMAYFSIPDGWSAEHLEALASSPAMEHCQELSIRGEVELWAIRILAASPHLSSLKTLTLSFARLGDEGCEALAAAPAGWSLRGLFLDSTEISEAGLSALSQAPALSQLQELTLGRNDLGSGAVEILAHSVFADSLKLLELSSNHPEDDGWGSALARALGWREAGEGESRFPLLRSLSLSELGLGDDDLRLLSQAPGATQLRVLKLYDNEIGDEGMEALSSSPHLIQLTYLDLTNNDIGMEGLRALARSPIMASLKKLEWDGYMDTDETGLLAFAAGVSEELRADLMGGLSVSALLQQARLYGVDVDGLEDCSLSQIAWRLARKGF